MAEDCRTVSHSPFLRLTRIRDMGRRGSPAMTAAVMPETARSPRPISPAGTSSGVNVFEFESTTFSDQDPRRLTAQTMLPSPAKA